MQKSHVEQQPQPQPQPDAEAENPTHFNNSLRELKDLSSQLHHAADYYQTSFLNDEHKGIVVENTKDYICKAMVIIVDHLGSISSNLEYGVSKSNTIPQTQLRIETLKQRLSTCQQYSHKLALTNIYWNSDFQRYHNRYTPTPADSSTMNQNSSSRETERSPNPGLLVGHTLSNLPKSGTTYFQFQETTPRIKRNMLNWKILNNKEIKSRIMRRGRRILT